jgi:hypothetical protein
MENKGRPFEPGNKFGRGRPRGSRNKNSFPAMQLLDSHAEPLMRRALVEALKGDVPLLRTLLGYVVARRQEAPLKTGPLPAHTAEELDQSSESVFQAVATGRITPQEARELSSVIECRRRVIETRDLDTRLRAVEQATAKSDLG